MIQFASSAASSAATSRPSSSGNKGFTPSDGKPESFLGKVATGLSTLKDATKKHLASMKNFTKTIL